MQVDTGVEVSIDYELFVDGELMEGTETDRPLTYTHGAQQIIPGLEQALTGLEVGDEKKVTVKPEEAYGKRDEEKIITIPKQQLPPEPEPQAGMKIQGTNADGGLLQGVIKKVDDQQVTIDFNHPLAGKVLDFKIKVVEVKPSDK